MNRCEEHMLKPGMFFHMVHGGTVSANQSRNNHLISNFLTIQLCERIMGLIKKRDASQAV